MPIDAKRIEEDARPRLHQEFDDLARCIAKIDIRRRGIATVDHREAVEIAMDARQSLDPRGGLANLGRLRSEEHTSELQSLMRLSYAVFCLKKKNTHSHPPSHRNHPLMHHNLL